MRLRFSWGATRFVVLVGTVAIKFARPRPFRALRRLIKYQVSGRVREKLLTYAEEPFLAGISYILSGVLANWNENRLWRESPSRFLMPTLFSCLLFNIQRRGERVSQEELDANHPLRSVLGGKSSKCGSDMMKAANFCRYEGRVCLADYGSREAFALFSRPQHRGAALANAVR